ncbi:MAG: hypothetical protein P8046_07265 [Anaerolineales bacterium]|jgi:hypothetical protein
MKNTHKLISIGMILVLLTISCSFLNVNRGDDGSLRVETNLTMDLIQSALGLATDLEQVVNLRLEPRDGYIYAQADSFQMEGISGTNVSFHLELGASNGVLTAKITNVEANGIVIDSSLFEPYNQMIAERLGQVTEMTDRASLETVSVTPDGVKMVWLLNTSAEN